MTADECLEFLRNQDTNNKGLILATFYRDAFGELSREEFVVVIQTMNKLSKMYGYEPVFFSILDCYDVDNFKYKSPYRLLSFFCKKRLEKKIVSQVNSLDEFAKEVEKIRERKLKFRRNIFG